MKKKSRHAEDVPASETESPTDAEPRPEPAVDVEEGRAGNGEAAGVAEYKDRWLRAEAELQDYRRRARREVEDARRSSEEAILLELIRWLDDLERALEAARASGAEATWAEGIALMLQKGRDVLERYGVQLVDPVGQPFDPRFQEAILEVDPPGDTAPGNVTQVVQKGYRRGDRALRAARVVVARSHQDES